VLTELLRHTATVSKGLVRRLTQVLGLPCDIYLPQGDDSMYGDSEGIRYGTDPDYPLRRHLVSGVWGWRPYSSPPGAVDTVDVVGLFRDPTSTPTLWAEAADGSGDGPPYPPGTKVVVHVPGSKGRDLLYVYRVKEVLADPVQRPAFYRHTLEPMGEGQGG